jgi:hypothetical protein
MVERWKAEKFVVGVVKHTPGGVDHEQDKHGRKGLGITKPQTFPTGNTEAVARQEQRLSDLKTSGFPMMRGMFIEVPEDMRDQIHQLMQPAMLDEDIDQHLKIGPMLTEFFGGKYGKHWTTSPRMATTASGVDQTGSGNLEVLLFADPPDVSQLAAIPDQTGVHSGDQEISITPGADLNINSIWIRDGQSWREVLDPNKDVFPRMPNEGRAFTKHGTHDQSTHGNWADGVTAFQPTEKGSAFGQAVRDFRKEFAALPDDALVMVYHATTQAKAKEITEGGLKVDDKPMTLPRRRYEAGEYAEFAPGAGISGGTYVSGNLYNVEGYGNSILAMKVPKGSLKVPPEGRDRPLDMILMDHDGAVVTTDVPASNIVNLYPEHRTHIPEFPPGKVFDAIAKHLPGKHDQKTHGNWATGRGSTLAEGVVEFGVEEYVLDGSVGRLNAKIGKVRRYTVDGHRVAVRYFNSEPELLPFQIDMIRGIPQETWEAARDPLITFTDDRHMLTLTAPSKTVLNMEANGLYWSGEEVTDTKGWTVQGGESNQIVLLSWEMKTSKIQHNLMHELGHSIWFHDVVGTDEFRPLRQNLEHFLDSNLPGDDRSVDWAMVVEDPFTLFDTNDLWKYPRSEYQRGAETFAEMFAYMSYPTYDDEVSRQAEVAASKDHAVDEIETFNVYDWMKNHMGGNVEYMTPVVAKSIIGTTGFAGVCGVPEMMRLMGRSTDGIGIEKRLSRSFGNKRKRQNQLVARLKRKRGYKAPVRGGTGKQARTRRRIFTKHLPGRHDQKLHGRRKLKMERLPDIDWSRYGVKRWDKPDRPFYDDWSPVMNPDDAERYMVLHGLNHVFYGAHATGDINAVMEQGFDESEIGDWNGWGRGLYMVHEDAVDYDQSGLTYAQDGTSIRIAMGMRNPLFVFADGPSEEAFEAMEKHSMGAVFHYDGPGEWPLDHYKIITEHAGLDWDPAWDEPLDPDIPTGDRAKPDWAFFRRKSDSYPGLATVLSDAGYDGMIIEAPYEFPPEFEGAGSFGGPDKYDPRWSSDFGIPAPGTGGSQAVVWDPQHTAIVGMTDWTTTSGVNPLIRRGEDREIVEILSDASLGELVSKRGLTVTLEDIIEVYGPWLVKKIEKHLPGQHDQKTHGNRKGKLTRGDWGKNGDERREGNRVSDVRDSVYPGDCYQYAGIYTNDGWGEENTLVHGIIRNPEGDIAHAWVVLPDGYIYEPTTDSVYHPEDFGRLHDPLVIQAYDPLWALQQMSANEHYGPWDEISDAWYMTYHGARGLHSTRSKFATEEVKFLMENE